MIQTVVHNPATAQPSPVAVVTPPALRPDLAAIVELIPAGSKVLDLGCGDGELLAYLIHAKQVKGRGIELSEQGVLTCVRRGLSVRQGNLNEGLADYPEHSFDYVVLSQTLPFLSDAKKILLEMLRVGQRAVVSFPNWGYWRCRLELLVRSAPLASLHYHRFRSILSSNRCHHLPGNLPGPRSPHPGAQSKKFLSHHSGLCPRKSLRGGYWIGSTIQYPISN